MSSEVNRVADAQDVIHVVCHAADECFVVIW